MSSVWLLEDTGPRMGDAQRVQPEDTVRLSNFDRWDAKMGGLLAKYRGDPLRTSS